MGPFSLPRRTTIAMPWTMGYDGDTAPTTHGGPMTCDCGADAEDIAAGIHNQPCTSREGAPDDPSDHYGQ